MRGEDWSEGTGIGLLRKSDRASPCRSLLTAVCAALRGEDRSSKQHMLTTSPRLPERLPSEVAPARRGTPPPCASLHNLGSPTGSLYAHVALERY